MSTYQKAELDEYEQVAVWDTDAKNYRNLGLPGEMFEVSTSELRQNVFWKNLFKYSRGLALEAGCGTGKNSLVLTKKGVTPVLLDFSRDTISYCKELFHDCGCDGFFIVADLLHLPFKLGAFDFVHSDSSMEHIVGFEEAIREIARVTRDGGHVFVTVPNKMRLDGSDLHKKLARVEHLTNSFTANQLRNSFETQFLVVKVFGYDVISPTLMLILRSITKSISKKASHSIGVLRDSASRSAARHARYEAGSSILEAAVLKWLDGSSIGQRLIGKWLTGEHSCFLSFNLCIVAKMVSLSDVKESFVSSNEKASRLSK